MTRWKRFAWFLFCFLQIVAFMAAAEKPAHAYVDPGSGLLFLQAAGSALLGALFVLRAKIRKLFGIGKNSDTTEPTPKNEAGPQA